MTLGFRVLILLLSYFLLGTGHSQSFDVIPQTSHVNGTKTAVFSPDGSHLVSSGFDCLIKVRKYPSGEVINQIKTAPGVVNSISFISPTKIVTGDSKGFVSVYDIFTGTKLLSRKVSFRQINSVIYDSTSRLFWCSGFGGLLTAVEPDSLFIHHIARNFSADVNVADISHDGSMIFLGSTSGMIYRFDTFTKMMIDSVEAYGSDVSGIRTIPGSKSIITASYSGEIRRYDYTGNISKQAFLLKPEPEALITSLSISPSGETGVISTFNNTIVMFDTRSGKVINTFPAHEYMIAGTVFRTESELLSFSFGHRSFIWDISKTSEPLRSFDGISGTVNKIASGKKWLIYSQEDGSVFAADLTKNLATKSLMRSLFPVTAISLDDEAGHVAIGTADGNLYLLDLVNLDLLYQEQFSSREIFATALNNNLLVVCGGDRKVRIVNLTYKSGSTSMITSPITGLFTSTALTPSNDLVAVGSSEGVIYYLDPANGNKVSTLAGHSKAVNSMAFNSSEKLFVSASADQTVRFWSTDEILNFKTLSNELGYLSGAMFLEGEQAVVVGEGGTVIYTGGKNNTAVTPEQNDISVEYPGRLGRDHFAALAVSGQIIIWNLKTGAREYIIVPGEEGLDMLNIRTKTLYTNSVKVPFLFPDADNKGTVTVPVIMPLKDLKVEF